MILRARLSLLDLFLRTGIAQYGVNTVDVFRCRANHFVELESTGGQLVRCESARYPEPTARAVLEDVLVPHLEGPIVGGLPFGHIADNRALGVGIEAELDGDRGTLRMLEAVVEEGE